MGAAATQDPPKAKAGEGAEANGNGEAAREPLDGEHRDEGQQDSKPKAPPIELEGQGQLSLKIGGRTPDKATAKLVGGKIAIPKGEYQPGEVIEAVVRLRVSKVGITHKVNDGETIEVEREHQFKMLQIEKVAG
jgi:hypothetical protein